MNFIKINLLWRHKFHYNKHYFYLWWDKIAIKCIKLLSLNIIEKLKFTSLKNYDIKNFSDRFFIFSCEILILFYKF